MNSKPWVSRLLFIGFLMLPPLHASELKEIQIAKQARESIRWEKSDRETLLLRINIEEGLSAEQQKLIYSGFPAYSLTDISMMVGGRETVLSSKSCSVRYELWDEKLKIIQVEGQNEQSLIIYDVYRKACLEHTISANQLPNDGSVDFMLFATLRFTQLSGDSSSKVRDWLIQQQSSMLRTLFSHMLGDLRVSEQTRIPLTIPSKPLATKEFLRPSIEKE